MKINISDSKQQTARLFSEYLVNLINNDGFLHIALSGGSTPLAVFKELAAEYKDAVDWSKVHFYWGDERCVPPEDSESNYKMANEHFFSKLGLPTNHIHRIQGENEPLQEAQSYASLLSKELPVFGEKPQFDLVILGLGDDGHTASIFPDQMNLWNSTAYCEVAAHPETGQKRITLTGNIINNAKEVAFLVTGASKAQIVLEVVERKGNYTSYPASLVNPNSGRLNWFLDQEASELLTQY